MPIDIDQMMIDELKRRWPDMSEDERAERLAAIARIPGAMTVEFEQAATRMLNEPGAFERFKAGLDALAKAVDGMPSVKP